LEIDAMMAQGHNPRFQDQTVLSSGIRATAPVFMTAVIFSFFINLLLFVSPLYMLQIYDRVIMTRNEVTLLGLTLIVGILLFVYAVLEVLRSRLLVRGGILFDRKIADAVFNAVHRANLFQPAAGHIQCLRDVDTVREFITGTGFIVLCDAPWFPIFVAVAFILHPWFGYLALVGGSVIITLTLLNEIMTKKHLAAAGQASMLANQNAHAMFRNTEVIQAMSMLSSVKQPWSKHHGDLLGLQALASDRTGVFVASTKFFRMFLQTSILGAGAYLVIKHEISPGSMIAASILIGRALQPIELAVCNWKGFLAARAAFDRIRALFTIAGTEPKRMLLPRPQVALQVSDLIASAPGKSHTPILKGLSFSLTAGEIVGVVGASAAGKSSLARAIVGAWPVIGGTVRLDGSDLTHWDPAELGKFVGYLPQGVELFGGTVAQNIARFQEIRMEAVMAAAQLAGCQELIQRLPEGFNNQIGEGGCSLSGGQRQRIGLARAVYGEPSLIVLDEPNANLDSEGEEALLKTLHKLKLMRRMVLLVTHKINVLAAVDKILVMGNGMVQALGPRDEIMHQLLGPRVTLTGRQPAAIGAAAAATKAE
jgi:ATP-binding cassette, subfamily C, bacterial